MNPQTKVLVLGVTFKENCPDIRNSRVIDIIREFEDYGLQVDVHDPNADALEVKEEYGFELKDDFSAGKLRSDHYRCVPRSVYKTKLAGYQQKGVDYL